VVGLGKERNLYPPLGWCQRIGELDIPLGWSLKKKLRGWSLLLVVSIK